jgi:hypothetical protein
MNVNIHVYNSVSVDADFMVTIKHPEGTVTLSLQTLIEVYNIAALKAYDE